MGREKNRGKYSFRRTFIIVLIASSIDEAFFYLIGEENKIDIRRYQ